jgi:hypothetical protein
LVNSSGTREGEPAGLHSADQGQGKYRARNVVEGVLRDYRLGHFGAEFQPVEQGDEDGGVCRGQYRSYEQGHREADAERGGDHQRDDEGCQEYAGQDEQAEAYGGPGDNLQRDAGAAVELAMSCESSPAPSMRPRSRRMCSMSTL